MVQSTRLQTTKPHYRRALSNAPPSAPSASPAKKAAKQAVKATALKAVARDAPMDALMVVQMAVVSAANVVAEAADVVIVTIAPKAAPQPMVPTTCKVQA